MLCRDVPNKHHTHSQGLTTNESSQIICGRLSENICFVVSGLSGDGRHHSSPVRVPPREETSRRDPLSHLVLRICLLRTTDSRRRRRRQRSLFVVLGDRSLFQRGLTQSINLSSTPGPTTAGAHPTQIPEKHDALGHRRRQNHFDMVAAAAANLLNN